MKKEFNQKKEIEHLQNKHALDKHFSKEEFNLKKEREKLFKIYKKRGVPTSLFKLIESQDERFIKLLKSYFANKDEAYINEIIDKLAGKKLI